MNQSPIPQPVKISFRLLLLGLVVVFALGTIGGFIGGELNRQPTTIPVGNGERFVTNVQQVTVSPNKNSAQIVDTLQRSLFLLGSSTATAANVSAVGISLTSDGVIATTSTIEGNSFIAIDQSGLPQPVNKIGTDEVYGITYFRLQQAVAVPVDIALEEGSVGSSFLAISRSNTTAASIVDSFALQTYVTSEDAPSALQRLMKSEALFATALPGTPLVTDEGKLIGLLLDPQAGLAIRASDVKESLDRFVAQKREYNPFTALGITVQYDFLATKIPGQYQFAATVQSVTAGSPAAISGIKAQDSITKIGNDQVTWNKNITPALSQPMPLPLTVVNTAGQERVVTLTPTAATP